MRLCLLATVAVVLAACAAPADASAARRHRPDRAREARNFALAFHKTVAESDAVFEAQRAMVDLRRLSVGQGCYDAVLDVSTAELSAEAADELLGGYLGYILVDWDALLGGAQAQLARRLARLPLHDATLRRARATIAAVAARSTATGTVAPPVADFCADLRAWGLHDYASRDAPATFTRATRDAGTPTPREQRRLEPAARRLVRRGVLSPTAAGDLVTLSLSGSHLVTALSVDPLVATIVAGQQAQG
jgi:hypothetical protein